MRARTPAASLRHVPTHRLTRPAAARQVASHAQKYFIRLNSQNKKDKRRASIHDITTVAPPPDPNSGAATGYLNMPITGANPAVAAAVGGVAPGAQPAQPVPGLPFGGMQLPRG